MDNNVDSAVKAANNVTEEIIENKTPAGSKGFISFVKKNSFFIGLAILVLIMAVVLLFDRVKILKGDIPYNQTLYIIGDNTISMARYGQERVTISSSLFENYEDQKLGAEAHNGILMNDDESAVMYVDKLHLIRSDDYINTRMVGTLNYFDGNRNIKIADSASFYYVVSDDFSKVMYKVYRVSDDKTRLISDLYKYDMATGTKELLAEDIDTDIFSMSNDGSVSIFLDDYEKSPIKDGMGTYSLYKVVDGNKTLVADKVYDLDASVFTGNAYLNYPLINNTGDKIVYTSLEYVYLNDKLPEELEEGEEITVYPKYDMYLYENNQNKLVAEGCAQFLVSYDFSQIIYIDNVMGNMHKYDEFGFSGDYYHYDIASGKDTLIAENVFGFVHRNVLGFIDNDYIEANYFYKNYDLLSNTAHLYTIRNDKQILIAKDASVGSDDELGLDMVSFSSDYKDVYVFKTYIPKTGSLLHRYTVKSNGSIDEFVCEEQFIISRMKISDDGKYLFYVADGRLVMIAPDNSKKTIEREGVNSFGITEGARFVYYYKETTLGSGALYYYDIFTGSDKVRFLKDVNEVWNYADDMVMFRMNTNFTNMTGDLYLTDFSQFQYISPSIHSQANKKVMKR